MQISIFLLMLIYFCFKKFFDFFMPISINSLYSVAKSCGRCKKIIQKITSTKQSRHAASLANYTAMNNSYKQISEMIVTTRNQISNSGNDVWKLQ